MQGRRGAVSGCPVLAGGRVASRVLGRVAPDATLPSQMWPSPRAGGGLLSAPAASVSTTVTSWLLIPPGDCHPQSLRVLPESAHSLGVWLWLFSEALGSGCSWQNQDRLTVSFSYLGCREPWWTSQQHMLGSLGHSRSGQAVTLALGRKVAQKPVPTSGPHSDGFSRQCALGICMSLPR